MPAMYLLATNSIIKKRLKEERLRRRYLRDASNPMDIPDNAFIALYRLNKAAFKMMLDIIAPDIGKGSVPEKVKLAASLRFLAVGSFQGVVANDLYIGMSRTMMCKVLWTVLNAIEEKICPTWINIELNAEDTKESKLYFYEKYGIPGVIGCVDGTHVRLIKPISNYALFYNRKGYYSLNVMIICDSNMVIRAVDGCSPGSSHDSFIWRMSDARTHYLQQRQNGVRNSWLLGDSGYGLEPFLITPYRSPVFGSFQHRFNQKHTSARNIVERTIGNLKSRFRCMQMALHYQPQKVVKIVNVCCALHNVCKKYNIPVDEDFTPASDEWYEVQVEDDDDEARNIRDNIASSMA